MAIESCEEEEIQEILASIDNDQNNVYSKVKFEVTCASTDMFTLNISNDLDEDDDQTISVKNEENCQSIGNSHENDEKDDNIGKETQFKIVLSENMPTLKVISLVQRSNKLIELIVFIFNLRVF
jgi:hypothetical protein